MQGVVCLASQSARSVEGHFGRQAMAGQPGFQIRPLSAVAGPFQFGYAVRASAGSGKSPALSA